MVVIQVLVLSMFVLYDSGSAANFAQYRQTKIIENNCDDLPIMSTLTPSKIGCARSCSENRECRRYLYCSSASSCKLYEDGTDCVMSVDSTFCACFRKTIGCQGTICTCPLGYHGGECQHVVEGCSEAFMRGMGDNLKNLKALTYIKPLPTSEPFEILCILGYGGGWYFLTRDAECSHDSFNRSLAEYEEGFGKTRNNFWVGFHSILDILATHNYQMQVHLVTNTKECLANFVNFKIRGKASGYAFLSASAQHRGGLPFCGDSFLSSISLAGYPFSTYDVDHTGNYQCARQLGGGWWFANRSDCSRGFLTGFMSDSQNDVFWLDDYAGEVIKKVAMSLWYEQ